MFTDFPAGAQKKLLERRGLRKEFLYVEDLFVGGEDFEDNEGGLLYIIQMRFEQTLSPAFVFGLVLCADINL